jgi:hypothetical protein
MPRRRSTIRGLRSLLYTFAKTLGDLSAVRRGPTAIVTRLARRQAGKVTGRMLGTLCR